MAGDVYLAEKGHYRPVPLDQDLAVVVVAIRGQLGVPEAETDSQVSSLVKEGFRGGTGHLGFEPGVDGGRVFLPPAGEKRRQRQLREHHQLGPMMMGFLKQRDEPLDHLGTGLVTTDGA